MAIGKPLRDLTPVEFVADHQIWLKRDDLFQIAGVNGGKARSCWHLSEGAVGLATGSSRVSTQCLIVSSIAQHRGIPCHIHTAMGELTPELLKAKDMGAAVFQHYNGFSATLASKARRDAEALGWTDIPFGMESREATECTKYQVENIPQEVERIVIALGSGISAAGIMWGFEEFGRRIPILGVRVGGGKKGQSLPRRLNKFAPPDWEDMMAIVPASVAYDKSLQLDVGGVSVDPHYEAKAVEFLCPGDLFWIVGHRGEVR